jgi:hypothetical protein
MPAVKVQPDEHAQTSASEHGDRHSSQLAGGPDGAEAARRVARAGRAAICRQNPSSRGHGTEGSLPRCGELTSRTRTRHRAPNREPGRIPVPGDGAAGDQGLRTGMPARRWRLRDACGLSRLNDFLALWPPAHLPSCNGGHIDLGHMAEPGSATAPRGPCRIGYCRLLALWRSDWRAYCLVLAGMGTDADGRVAVRAIWVAGGGDLG